MKKYQFKTTMKCNHCVAKVKETLDTTSVIAHWEIDLKSQDRILTIESEQENVAEKIIHILKEKGFQGELIS